MRRINWVIVGLVTIIGSCLCPSNADTSGPVGDGEQQNPGLPVQGTDALPAPNIRPGPDNAVVPNRTRPVPPTPSPSPPPISPDSRPGEPANTFTSEPLNPVSMALAAPAEPPPVIVPGNASAIARSNLAGFTPTFIPNMFGDQPPTTVRTFSSSPIAHPNVPRPPRPPGPPGPPPVSPQTRQIVPSARGFKIADNQSPEPRDRFFYTFNYFDDLNGSINRQIQSPTVSQRAYRHIFGFEKTFLDGNASLGVRVPLNTFTINNPLNSNTSTSVGDLAVFSKYVLWRSDDKQSLISSGLAVTTPTGPRNFAGAPSLTGFRSTSIQPFLGGIYRRDRFFAQAFEAIDVATNSRDVTLIYNDYAIGYFLYESKDPRAFIKALVPTFETHVNIPLNHRGAQRPGDPSATGDQVNLTLGTTLVLKKNATLAFSFGQPVVGPNAFNYETALLFNYYFGRSRTAPATLTPPILGL